MELEGSTVINRSVEEVFDYMTDINHVAEWMPVKQIRQTSDGPLHTGSTLVQTVEVLGKDFDATTEIISFERPVEFSIKADSGPLLYHEVFHFEPVDEGTRLKIKINGDPGGVFKIAAPLLKSSAQKELDSQLETIKKELEKGHEESKKAHKKE